MLLNSSRYKTVSEIENEVCANCEHIWKDHICATPQPTFNADTICVAFGENHGFPICKCEEFKDK